MSLVNRFKVFIAELKRRKVFHVGSIYLITAWGASLGAAELFPAFGVPDWGVRAFVIAAVLGFPLAVGLAWVFEITAGSIVLDPGRDTAMRRVSIGGHVGGATTTWEHTHSVRIKWQLDGEERFAEFYKDFVIGRDADADVCLENSKVSRLHAKVTYEKGRWSIVDLCSRNGIRVNGNLISETTPLQESNELVFYDGGPPINVVIRKQADDTALG